MPSLDDCINDRFEPGNIPSSSGATPVIPPIDTFLDPDAYDPDSVEYSLNGSKFYNSFYFLLGFV